MIRRLVAATLILVLAACARTPGEFTADEARLTARWLEDVATGEVRRPGELRLRPSSPGMARVAAWLAGADVAGTWQGPPALTARRQRRQALDASLAAGQLLVDPRTALVGPAPGLKPEPAANASALAEAENRDRQFIDALVIARARATGESEEAYLATVRSERLRRDMAAGGKPGRRQGAEPDR